MSIEKHGLRKVFFTRQMQSREDRSKKINFMFEKIQPSNPNEFPYSLKSLYRMINSIIILS